MTALAPNAIPAPFPSGFKKTESNAIERRERNKAPADVRAARAAILAETDARAEATREAEQRHLRRPFELVREILTGATDEQVAEMAVHAGRLDPAGLAQVATDMVGARTRARRTTTTSSSWVPSLAPSPVTAPEEAPEKPARPRGRPKATVAA